MTLKELAGMAGVIFLCVFLLPGLNVKFAALPKETKQLSMAVILLGSSVLIFLLGCGEIIQAGITCDKQGAIQMVLDFYNLRYQLTRKHLPSPHKQSVKAIKQKTG